MQKELHLSLVGNREQLLRISKSVVGSIELSCAAAQAVVEGQEFAAPFQGGIGKDRFEALELFGSDQPGRVMEGVDPAVAQGDERHIVAQQADNGGRLAEVALLPGPEEQLVGALLDRVGDVEIVVAGDPGDAGNSQQGLQQAMGLLELAVEGQPGQVAGEEDVVGPGLLQVSHQRLGDAAGFPEVVFAAELQVEPADDALGEQRPPGDGSRGGGDVDIAEMGDLHEAVLLINRLCRGKGESN